MLDSAVIFLNKTKVKVWFWDELGLPQEFNRFQFLGHYKKKEMLCLYQYTGNDPLFLKHSN